MGEYKYECHVEETTYDGIADTCAQIAWCVAECTPSGPYTVKCWSSKGVVLSCWSHGRRTNEGLEFRVSGALVLTVVVRTRVP